MENNKLTILIVPIGNYKAWKKVRYKLNDNEVESRTSMKIIQESFKPDKTIFILSDTLIDNIPLNLIKNLDKYDFQKIKELIKNDIINELLKEENIEFDENYFIISFGKGYFINENEQKITIINGDSVDYYYYVLFSLANLFFDCFNNNYKINRDNKIQDIELEVIIDTTHGINYQTILVYKAILELLKIFAFYFKNVYFKVYNSDPFINPNLLKKYSLDIVLNVNLIENVKIIPSFNIFKDNSNKFLRISKDNIGSYIDSENEIQKLLKEKTKIEKVDKKFMDNVYSFVSAFVFGCPLYVIYFIPEPIELYNIIIQVFNNYIQTIDFEIEDNKITITRKLAFTMTFENFIKIYTLTKILSLLGVSKKLEVSLNELENFNFITYKKYFPVEYNKNSKEIYYLKRSISSYEKHHKSFNWIKYSELKSYELNKDSINRIPDERNFFAHSGFEYNSIWIKKINNQIYLKPNDEFLDYIRENILVGNLPSIR